jgi:MoaA/NifB/PqqE/SkfB family radical SAM enzyme
MIIFRGLDRKRKAWDEGVAHATLDPDGPGVARMHLVPPKPILFKDPPSLLIINGTWFLPVGPSWALVLRVFFSELQKHCENKRNVTPEEADLIEKVVVAKVLESYPKTDPELILDDLKEIVTLGVNIATKGDIPREALTGMDLEEYSRYMTAPHRMDLILSPMSINNKRVCPLECVCCYADYGELMNIEKPLETHEWKEIIDKCKDAGIPMLTFTGGEPLTRPDIVELVRYSSWFVTRLNTSGYNLTKELAVKLHDASLDGIQITLYSDNSEIHNSLVGRKGAFEKTIAGIKNALDAGLSVSINTPLVEKNKDYLSLIRFAHNLGVCCVGCSSLIPTGNAVEQIQTGKALSTEELKKILKEAVALCNELNMDISFTSPGWIDSKELLALGLPSAPVCGACLSNMAITPSGDVVPCQSWLKGETLGNILNESWSKIWNSKRCRSIRKDHAVKPICALKGASHEI